MNVQGDAAVLVRVVSDVTGQVVRHQFASLDVFVCSVLAEFNSLPGNNIYLFIYLSRLWSKSIEDERETMFSLTQIAYLFFILDALATTTIQSSSFLTVLCQQKLLKTEYRQNSSRHHGAKP